MRALRDFNTTKIVTEDTTMFMGLIGDLFPELVLSRKRDLEFEKQVRQAIIYLKLQPEDNFILKVLIKNNNNNLRNFYDNYIHTGSVTSGFIGN